MAKGDGLLCHVTDGHGRCVYGYVLYCEALELECFVVKVYSALCCVSFATFVPQLVNHA